MVRRIFLYFFERKMRGSGFWTIKIYFVDHRTIRKIGYEEKRLETNHWRQTTQRTRYESCVCLLKWTSFLLFWVQLQDARHRAQKWNTGKSFTVRRIWNKRERTSNVLRMFRETHAISARSSSTPQDMRVVSRTDVHFRIQRRKTEKQNGFTLWIRFVS